MTRRLRARLALLRLWWERFERDLDTGFNRALAAPVRALMWLWNTIKTAPGVLQVGHGIATVLGLYRLDRWLVERECKADLKLADVLAETGLSKQATMLREAVVERRAQDAQSHPRPHHG